MPCDDTAQRRSVQAAALLILFSLTTACGDNEPRSRTDEATVAAVSEATPAETAPQPAAVETQPAVTAPATVTVVSDPPGASVEIGLQVVDNILQPGSGRIACETPCDVTLRDSDVNAGGGISIMLRKPGYYDLMGGISDGRKKIAAGGKYDFSGKLNPML